MQSKSTKPGAWTEAELERLREQYPYLNNADLLEAFPGRTISSLYSKASKLGIARMPGVAKAGRQAAIQKAVYRKNPRLAKMRELAEDGWRPCGRCLEIWPEDADHFVRKTNGRNGLASICKVCSREEGLANAAATREERRAYFRQRHRDKREEILAYQREYRANNKEKAATNKREWNRQNPERNRANQRAWRASRTHEQLEAEREYQRVYAKEHRLELNAKARRRRVLRYEAEGSHTVEEVWQMAEDQGHLCAYCEHPLMGDFHVDHLIPLSKGGRDDWSNLAIACALCNLRKNALMPLQFLKRLGYSVAED